MTKLHAYGMDVDYIRNGIKNTSKKWYAFFLDPTYKPSSNPKLRTDQSYGTVRMIGRGTGSFLPKVNVIFSTDTIGKLENWVKNIGLPAGLKFVNPLQNEAKRIVADGFSGMSPQITNFYSYIPVPNITDSVSVIQQPSTSATQTTTPSLWGRWRPKIGGRKPKKPQGSSGGGGFAGLINDDDDTGLTGGLIQ